MAELNIFHYLPQKSVIHAMDGRIKLIGMILFSITTSIATRILDLSVLTLVILLALIGARLPLKKLLIEIKYFIVLISLVMVVHSFSIPGTPITHFLIPNLTWEGLRSGVFFGWRIILIVLLSTILTATTTLSTLKNVIEWFLRPIPLIRATKVATMFSLTFVLIPLVFDQASELLDAQKARCIEGRKNPIKRVIFLVYPLLLHTFIRADEMVYAMESRCYSEKRTPVLFKTNALDWLLLVFLVLICTNVFFNFF